MGNTRKHRDRWPIQAVVLLGMLMGVVPWSLVVAMNLGQLSGGIGSWQFLVGLVYAYGIGHLPWLCHESFGWPNKATDISVLAINTIYYPLLFLVIRHVIRKLRRRRVDELVPHCLMCDYNLTGNESGKCPECGESVGDIRPLRQ